MDLPPTDPLVFRPEDAQARRTGKTVVRHLKAGRHPVLWAFFPSGLQFLATCQRLPIADATVTIRHGSLDDEIPGTAHALEHLVCKDPLVDGPHPALAPLIPLGLRTNAWTGDQMTTYWAQTQNRGWRELLDGLIEAVFFASTIDPGRWDVERPAILQEIHGRDETKRIQDAIRAARFPHVPRLQVPTIGLPEDIERLKAYQLRAVYETAYHPRNALIVLQGLADPERAIAHLERHRRLAAATARRVTRHTAAPFDYTGKPGDLEVRVTGGNSVERLVCLSEPFPDGKDRHRNWRTGCLASRICNMPNGAINAILRRDRGLIYGGSVEQARPTPWSRRFSFSARMKEARMADGEQAWKELWRRLCAPSAGSDPRIQALLNAATGYQGLIRAEERLKPFADREDAFAVVWLTQAPRPDFTTVADLTPEAFRAEFRHLPRFHDLRWQTIRVLPTR